jgi:hypothetical protein
MIYFVDIDNTICKTVGNDYPNAVPVQENINKINNLFDKGNIIVYWTSRGRSSGKDLHFFTIGQLCRWGCRFNSVWMNKPSFDVLIDDKAINIDKL